MCQKKRCRTPALPNCRRSPIIAFAQVTSLSGRSLGPFLRAQSLAVLEAAARRTGRSGPGNARARARNARYIARPSQGWQAWRVGPSGCAPGRAEVNHHNKRAS